MRYLVISTSLNPRSRSRILAEVAFNQFKELGVPAGFQDLAKLDLPICDASSCYGHAEVMALAPRIEAARGIIVATAIYNYDVNSAAKNLLELTGDAWTDKVVGFVCAAGGHGSYMSVMGFANSLMLDYRCVIVPRFVYAPSADIADAAFGDKAIGERVGQLAGEMVRITEALFPQA
jgi:FMN reductase